MGNTFNNSFFSTIPSHNINWINQKSNIYLQTLKGLIEHVLLTIVRISTDSIQIQSTRYISQTSFDISIRWI